MVCDGKKDCRSGDDEDSVHCKLLPNYIGKLMIANIVNFMDACHQCRSAFIAFYYTVSMPEWPEILEF